MLANIVGRLPSMGGSHFIEARRADPALLDAVLDLDEDGRGTEPDWHPLGTEWTQSDELLTKILDAISALVAIGAAHPIPAGGKRPTIPTPHPRPVRALDEYRAERRIAQMAELDDEVERAKERWRAASARGDLPVDD